METNSYTSAMSRLTVTPELRARMLEGVERGESRRKMPSKLLPMAMAACLLVVVAVLFLPRRGEQNILVNNPMHQAESVAELKASAPFPLSAPGAMPEGYTVESTFLIAGELAQIKYAGPQGVITYRMAVGDEDISGDYNTYAETGTQQMGAYTVTVKGAGGNVSLCTWTDSVHTYALSFEAPVAPETANAIIKSVGPVA